MLEVWVARARHIGSQAANGNQWHVASLQERGHGRSVVLCILGQGCALARNAEHLVWPIQHDSAPLAIEQTFGEIVVD